MPRNSSRKIASAAILQTNSSLPVRPSSQGRSGWLEPAICAAVCVAVLVPFINKAVHLDDTMFIYVAKQIASHSTDPFGFSMNWYGTQSPVHELQQNGPLVSYYMALAASLLGWSEIACTPPSYYRPRSPQLACTIWLCGYAPLCPGDPAVDTQSSISGIRYHSDERRRHAGANGPGPWSCGCGASSRPNHRLAMFSGSTRWDCHHYKILRNCISSITVGLFSTATASGTMAERST